MLADEVTTSISQQVNLTGAGSPFVFSASGSKKILTKFKVDSVEKDIRAARFNANNLLEVELTSFSPTGVSATGQTLNWDQPATSFSVAATNPADFTTEFLNDIVWPITQVSGTVEILKAGYGSYSPLSASGALALTFTLGSGKYIRPSISGISGAVGPATGGSASATVVFNKRTAGNPPTDTNYTPDPAATYTWTTNWASVTHSITAAALSGNSFLQSYTGTTYSITNNTLTNTNNVSRTVTATLGTLSNGEVTLSNAGTTGTLTFATPVHKNNATTVRKVSLSSVFTRPEAVTGTGYTHTPSPEESTVTYSFDYPSITLKTVQSAGLNGLTSSVIVDNGNTGNKGFKSTVTRMSETKVFPVTKIVNSTNEDQYFWFGVSSTTAQPSVFESGSGASFVATATPEIKTIGLAPTFNGATPVSAPDGYQATDYIFYGFIVPNNPGADPAKDFYLKIG